ncbi:MAG TPA: FtsX-like permease family protein [Gemmatimonadaceae bacterium]|nr:FtsX-like permease family protein [Gemmatimonadaceae bacterium]
MITVALKGLAGRKVRALLTAFAVVIGVTMVSGTLVLTDTIQKAFDGIFGASYEQTDAVIAGKEIVKGSQSGAATVPESLLAKVRALPEVEDAGGTIAPNAANTAQVFGRDGKAVGTEGAPQFGLGIDASLPQFTPLQLKTGRWPEGPSQVAVDADTAAGENLAVGDEVTVSTLGVKRRYELTGIASFGGVDSLGGATIAIWDLPTAQTLLGKEGRFDGISIAAKDGTSTDDLVRAVQPLIPASLEVKDSEQQAAADAKETNVIVNAIRYFLLGFGGIALFVGAFVIFNTLSITVAQRTREFATLRTLGASRRQVMRSVVIEGAVLGLMASVLGLFAGFGLAKLLTAIGGDMPEAGMVFALRTVLISLVLGTTITVLASIVPALRATRVPPIAAVREGSTLPPSRFAAHSLKTAVAVIAASVVSISLGIFADGIGTLATVLLLGGGIVALFGGVALAAPHMVKPLTGLVGFPARRGGGIAGDLASANSVRNPSRTASTAAALMIGLTLVTVVAVLGAGMRSTVESAVTDQINAAYILNGNDGMPFQAAEGDALARVPGVQIASHVRVDKALVSGEENDVTGVDPATIARFYTFEWTDGSDAAVRQLGSDGALVTQTYADDHDLAVGDSLALQTASGDRRTVVVRGIYDPPEIEQMLGSITISRQVFDAVFPQPKNRFTFIEAGPDADGALTAAAAEFTDAAVHTGTAFAEDYTQGFSEFLNFLYVLLAFSVVVSLFGMVNTLVLSVFERTRELGMLRTIGMTRRQARRMIRHESVITALIGAALGLPLGIVLALLVTQALSEYDIAVAIPVGELVGFTVVAILAGLAAAITPARRASRLNVLDALHYE